MRKFLRKCEHYCTDLIALVFYIAFVAFSFGCAIWAFKWVLSLLGVI